MVVGSILTNIIILIRHRPNIFTNVVRIVRLAGNQINVISARAMEREVPIMVS